MKIMFNQVN